MPKLLYFEKGIPTVYEGKLENEEELLKWLERQTNSDEIEDVTNEMLDLIIEKMPLVAVLFCKFFTGYRKNRTPRVHRKFPHIYLGMSWG
jgi:hypothetical protein